MHTASICRRTVGVFVFAGPYCEIDPCWRCWTVDSPFALFVLGPASCSHAIRSRRDGKGLTNFDEWGLQDWVSEGKTKPRRAAAVSASHSDIFIFRGGCICDEVKRTVGFGKKPTAASRTWVYS